MRRDKVVTEVLGEEIAVTPSDLYNKKFKRALVGGYSRATVDAFLERVADVLEALIAQVRELKEKYEESKAQLEEYRQMEATLRNALTSSRKFSESIIETAKREAHTLVEEARLARAQAQLGAAKLPTELSRDIVLLQDQRERLRAEMLAILDTHKNLLDSLIPQMSEATPSSVFELGDARADPEDDAQADEAPHTTDGSRTAIEETTGATTCEKAAEITATGKQPADTVAKEPPE